MDPQIPTCVVDAITLTDHIHGIKKLIYDGQVRLTVPLSSISLSSTNTLHSLTSYIAIESVEKIYQKSIEPKPEPKEAVRPKPSGRPVKVHPTFDINPRVVREFLDRCKIEDSKLNVEFQQEAEQYTPWKDLQEQEEEQKDPDAKPVDYAAALLKKLAIKAPIQATKGMWISQGLRLCSKMYYRANEAKVGGAQSEWTELAVEKVPADDLCGRFTTNFKTHLGIYVVAPP